MKSFNFNLRYRKKKKDKKVHNNIHVYIIITPFLFFLKKKYSFKLYGKINAGNKNNVDWGNGRNGNYKFIYLGRLQRKITVFCRKRRFYN
jgi:hypothetical protein